MSDKFILPSGILKQHLITLGKTGSGKSSKLRYIVEHLLDQGKRVVIIDPKGDWWGIKLGADGKSAGYPVILFGDFKNADARDVPINDRSGKHIAELIATGNRPAVIGFRGWTQGAMIRFWIDFASTLFSVNAGELFLVGDEFHNFAPKQWKGMSDKDTQVGVALHWSNRLLSEGRGIGLVCLLASQRPQKVHNDTNTSCETLIAARVVHPADRAAVKLWIDGNGDPELGAEVLATLGNMPREDAWVWSPEIGYGPKRITFPMFKTFDSFAPPQLQKRISSKGWADVDLDAVKEKLATVIKEHEANDPKALKQQVAKLRQELLQAQKQQPAPAPAKTKTVEKFALKDGQLNRVEAILDRMGKVYTQAGELEAKLLGGIDQIRGAIKQTTAPVPPVRPVISQRRVPIPQTPRPIARKIEKLHESGEPSNGELRISGTQQRVLDALAWYESLGTAEPTVTQIGAVALIDSSGGHFSNTVGPLSTAGLVVRGAGSLRLTDAGRAVANIPESAGSLDEYHDVLRRRVRKMKSAGGKTIEMLDVIIKAGGESLTAESIGEAVNIDHTGGHFSNMIGPLGTAGLIERRAGMVTPTEVLFPPALMEVVTDQEKSR